MNANIEKLEGSIVKFIVDIDAQKFEEGLKFSYNQNKNKFSIPGFRKGKVPRFMIEKQYGAQILYDDAINHVFPEIYEAFVSENDLEVVSRPNVDIVEDEKENGIKLSVEVTVKPDVTLGDYKNLTYPDKEVVVSEEDLNERIEQERRKNARIVSVTDRAVQMGDTAVIDCVGYMDGEAFEGGQMSDYKLEIGSHSFIDTFEDQLVGHEIGDHVAVNVTFPEEYGQKDLAGKPALFEVDIKEITETQYPELNDEFAEDVSEFDTFEAYQNDIKNKLLHEKEHAREHEIEDLVIQTAADNMTADIPDVMVENQIDQMLNGFANNLQRQGLSFDMFLQYTGQTMDALRASYREGALGSVKARLMLEAIADAENIEVSDGEFEEELQKIADQSGIELEKLQSIMRPEDIKGLKMDIKTQKAAKIVIESATAVKGPEEEKAPEEN